MGLRHRSIRLRVGILIVVPVLCLLALYGFAVSITLGNALAAEHAKSIRSDVANPVGALQVQLATERHLALQLIANPDNTSAQSAFGDQETKTQSAVNSLTLVVGSNKVMANASASEQQAISALIADTQQLSYIRGDVTNDAYSLPAALDAYDSIINAGYTVLDQAIDQETAVPWVTQALSVINLGRASQAALAEGDLLAADITQGKFPNAERAAFAGLASLRQSFLNTAMPELQPAYKSIFTSSLTPAVSDSLTALEAKVIGTSWSNGGVPPGVASAPTAFTAYNKALGTALSAAAVKLQAQAQHEADTIFLQLILAGGLGLLGIIASIALSLIIGRGLVRQLRDLRQSALTLAHDKLPNVIRQLRAGQAVDVTEYEPGEISTSNEIEQVQHAFGVVQHTAVQSAVDEARLRRGISDVFRNLAGRSQSLLHRQLTLLDGMERRATEPDELEDLFRIDHLTTRMRRHAEGLIILSGETPARGWRQPVPLVDVLRAAVAEVEDYTRVRVLSRTNAAVAGHAVADIIHLIAELAENATVFSPPNTPVRIQGDVVGRGFAIEIEDRGLGISPQRLAEINTNLANPPQFDLSGSDRLGLFITGQLAQRHDIKVTLRPSVYGGTTAIVLIPTALVVDADSYEQDPALTSGESATSQSGRLAGRHAALEPVTSLNGAGRVTAEVDPDYAGTSLAIGSAAESAELTSATGFVRPGTTEPAGHRAFEPTNFSTASPSAFGTYEATGFSRASAGLPDPAAGKAPEPNSFGAAEPSDGRLPERTVTGSPVSEGDPRVTTAELTDVGLPVRVRQASLAPQLRNSGPAGPPTFGPASLRSVARPSGLSPSGSSPTGGTTSGFSSDGLDSAEHDSARAAPPRGIDVFAAASRPADPAVSPEAARNTVSALQRGWLLGRAEAAATTSRGPSAGDSDAAGEPAGPDLSFDSDERRTD
ncbi:MAG: nitrate- and nitrite sensing domain-containing protein [Streptosporangiaceae bacterium]